MTTANSVSRIGLLRERDGGSKVSILAHPLFWAVLAVKIAALFLIASSVLVENYIPFVNYFIQSGFANPYTHFASTEISFPFPSLMLLLLAMPKLLFGLPAQLDLFVLRIPILLADLGIFLILIRWLKDRQQQVLWYYWCSPILFAIGYIAGFLDIVPIALLFSFLYFLFKDKYAIAFVLLGLALATKTGLVILLPFIGIYLLKEYARPLKATGLMLLSGGIYLLLNLEYLSRPEFWHMILAGGQSFASALNIDFGGSVVYIAPLVYLGLLASSLVFHRLSKDLFLMFIAFALGTITLVMMPQAGWYAWIIPFFIYFFVKADRAQRYPFAALNVAYFAYFIAIPDSPYLEAFSIPAAHLDPVMLNIAFTLLQGTLLLNVAWIYGSGIQKGIRDKILYKPYLIGIAGDSASGKSTLANLITKVFGEHNTLEVAGDDMHKWERGDANWSRLTHLNPVANHLHVDMEHARLLKRNEGIMRRFYDHAVGRFTAPAYVRPKKIIVFQGLHALYLHRARQLLDLKIYLAPDEALRRQWKVDRDIAERGHDPEHILTQLDARAPDAERYIGRQREHADVVISINKTGVEESLHIDCDNSIHVDPLISLLEDVPTLTITHGHDNDRQHLLCTGSIDKEAVERLAYAATPEVWDINRREVQWDGGLNGILQLFLAYIVFYKAKLDHDSC